MGGLGLIVILLGFGLGGAVIARSKGNPVFLWFLIAFLVPFAGLAAALFAPSNLDEPRRSCETCGKVVPLSQTLCSGCGAELYFPEETLPPRRVSERRA
jgi:hypothetical protein